MARNVSSFFVAHGIIQEADWEVYVYSFEILFSTAVSFLAVTILAIVSRTLAFTLLYMTGFVPLRILAGGYHAKNHFRCFLVLLAVYSAFLLLINSMPTDVIAQTTIMLILLSLSVLSVFRFAPSEDRNKPLSTEESVRFKKRSRLAIVCYSVLVGLQIVFVSNKIFAFALTLGVFTVAVSLLANFIKNEHSEIRNNAECGKEKKNEET